MYTFSADNFTCRLSWSISTISAQFSLLKCAPERKIKKMSKPFIFEIQGRSTSSMLMHRKLVSSACYTGLSATFFSR